MVGARARLALFGAPGKPETMPKSAQIVAIYEIGDNGLGCTPDSLYQTSPLLLAAMPLGAGLWPAR
jgi:hypothetical protein